MEYKKFNPLNVSSKFAICGLPIRLDTYKTCSFGCKYCFSNCRKIMEFQKELQVGNVEQVRKKPEKIFDKNEVDYTNFLETLISQRITWHCGGMSDPFQPIEKELGITKQIVDVTNRYGINILFSTKTDNIYGCNVNPSLHSFQMSITNINDRKDIEPNVPSISKRYELFKQLKRDGYKVGIRIQPMIPGITTTEIIDMFSDADHFTIEGIKIVPQNEEHKNEILELTKLKKEDFTQMGLLNLRPEKRIELYKPFIEKLENNGASYSIADNDMHHMGNNYCCCGDSLVANSTNFNNTFMCHWYGKEYAKELIDEKLFEGCVRDCKCNYLFTSNRQEGCESVQDFYDKRFYRKSSPFSPLFLYEEG